MGDLVDRGPDGIGAVELVMHLEQQGDVRCLLGNHEVLLLAVDRLPDHPVGSSGATFADVWLANGGQLGDLRRLDGEHRSWLVRRPAIAADGAWLLLHADTDRYLELGSSVEAVCAAAGAALAGSQAAALARLFEIVSDRGRLTAPGAVDDLLGALGGERIVHGHTPIAFVVDRDPLRVTEPLSYAGGRALNVDHCLFAGGPGFVVEL